MIHNYIYLVNKDNVVKLEADQITVESVGGKAYGLLQVPQAWSAPFFVISKQLFSEYVETNDKNVINAYSNNIRKCLDMLEMGKNIIIRSSAVNEGMSERGKFDSKEANVDNFELEIAKLLEKLKDIPNEGMPIIVQKMIVPQFTGHMSNERRFSQDSRDWKIETYQADGSFEQDTVAVRTWRLKFDVERIKTTPLAVSSKGINHELLKIAYHWYMLSKKMKCRFHIEFVFDGKSIYVVQADNTCSKKNAVNPKEYDIKVNKVFEEWKPKILKQYNVEESSVYSKLQNVKNYHDLGFCTVPLYFLEDKNTLLELKQGKVNDKLKEDIQALLGIHSLVIRMDLQNAGKSEKQMLPRSNELYIYEEVVLWLKKYVDMLLGEKEGCFIFHNFVPATASAFAHVVPNGRLVRIQSLWGLPEGLYYNYHDTIIVDLGPKDLMRITEADVKVTVKNKYKDIFVCPDADGKWLSYEIKEPHDWKCSIENNASILDIAVKSQKLANKLQKEISVMWFVGIDCSFYGAHNLPWFHEEVSITSYTTDSYKRKYFQEEEKNINNSEELEELINSGSIENIKCLRLKPNCEKDLRNKELLVTIGKLAAKNDIMILLDGTQLTHSYYQLKGTGAKVVCSDKDELLYSDTLEFNKLVRDQIPEKIISNGEHVKCLRIVRPFLDRLLLEKLLEEAYEVNDSETLEDMISELADVTEVSNALLDINKHSHISALDILCNKKRNFLDDSQKLLSIKIPVDSCVYRKNFRLGDTYCNLFIQRQKTVYKVEFNIQNHKIKQQMVNQQTEESVITKLKKEIVLTASKALNSKDPKHTIKFIDQIKVLIYDICNIIGISVDQVEQRRKSKAEKLGGFKRGYMLKQTVLKDNIIDEVIEFNPDTCRETSEIERDNYKYFELLQDQEKSNKRLLFRFSAPIAANNWEIKFESSKISELLPETGKLKFEIKKSVHGVLQLTISSKRSETYEQMFLFDLL